MQETGVTPNGGPNEGPKYVVHIALIDNRFFIFDPPFERTPATAGKRAHYTLKVNSDKIKPQSIAFYSPNPAAGNALAAQVISDNLDKIPLHDSTVLVRDIEVTTDAIKFSVRNKIPVGSVPTKLRLLIIVEADGYLLCTHDPQIPLPPEPR